MTTIKIKSTDEATQGLFVIINRADFDSSVHEPFDDEARASELARIHRRERRRGAPPF